MFAAGDNEVRDHDNVTGTFRGSGHWNCNIDLKLTWKIWVILSSLKGCDSHLIVQEIGKFDVKINVIPNELEKYVDFIFNKNLIFIDSLQFLNLRLDDFTWRSAPLLKRGSNTGVFLWILRDFWE